MFCIKKIDIEIKKRDRHWRLSKLRVTWSTFELLKGLSDLDYLEMTFCENVNHISGPEQFSTQFSVQKHVWLKEPPLETERTDDSRRDRSSSCPDPWRHGVLKAADDDAD